MSANGTLPVDARMASVKEVQVSAKAGRRTYTAEYKRQILKEADACTAAGAVEVVGRRAEL